MASAFVSGLAPGAVLLSLTAGAIAHAAELKTDNGAFFVECRVNAIPDRCQIDTGSGGVASLRRIEPFSKLPVTKPTVAMGVAGVAEREDQVEVDSITVGELVVDHPGDVVVSARAEQPTRLGLGFFASFERLTFDFRHGVIGQGGPDPSHRCEEPFDRSYVMRIPVTLGGRGVVAAWDTGANYTAADLEFVRAHPEIFDYVRTLSDGVDSTAASVATSLYRAKLISFCGRDFADVPVVAVDMSGPKKAVADFPDLFLGANLMTGHVWSFDFTDRSWSFD